MTSIGNDLEFLEMMRSYRLEPCFGPERLHAIIAYIDQRKPAAKTLPMKTHTEIDTILAPFAPHRDAARREGWDLFQLNEHPQVQVQRIVDPEDLPSGIATHLPNDTVAKMMVRTGTGENHRAARQIIHEHFPEEWEALNAAACAPTTLTLLRQAVAARIASWDAAGALETHLGFPGGDVPDKIDTFICDEINSFASSYPGQADETMPAITQAHADDFEYGVGLLKAKELKGGLDV